jgi:Fe-S cluster assembly protein SufD
MSTFAGDRYLASLLTGAPAVPAGGTVWFNRVRSAALERANALAVPTTGDEDWRFTDLSALKKLNFQPAPQPAQIAAADLDAFAIGEAAVRLTFIDGVFTPAWSSQPELPDGVIVTDLQTALNRRAAAIEPHLAQHARFENAAFTAVNTSFLRDGAVVIIGAGCACPDPLHLLFVASRRDTPQAIYPRCLVIAEAGSECRLVEDYIGLGDGAYLTNAVTEIVLGEGARVEHTRVQRESDAAFHIGLCAVSQQRDSVYTSRAVSCGARLSRYDLAVLQQGEGTQTSLDGLALIAGRQLADTHTCMQHARPSGRSEQLHKCIVGGGAHAVFSGKVLVKPGAQLTDSRQSSRNLLLTPRARVDTKPQLEIFADDVKCAHGATVGQLDEDAVFYLRSRGLSDQAARNLLTYAFAAEVIDRIPIASVRSKLRQAVLQRTTEKNP